MFPLRPSLRANNRQQRPPDLRPETEPLITRKLSRYSRKDYKNKEADASPIKADSKDSDQRESPDMSEESGQHSESESSDFQEDRNSESSEGGLEREDLQKRKVMAMIYCLESILNTNRNLQEGWRLESGSNSKIRNSEDESRTFPSSKTISATPITSARNKVSTNLQITISDDRSCGRKRIQIASEEAPSKNNPSFESPWQGTRILPLEGIAYSYPAKGVRPGGFANPALEGYQRQMRQMTFREKDALGLESPNEFSTHFLAQGNDPEPNRYHVDENCTLNHDLRIIRENLNIQDGSLLTIEILHPDKDEYPNHNSEVIELKSQDIKAAMKTLWKYFNFGVDDAVPTRDIILSIPYLPIFHIRRKGLSSFLKTLEDTKRQEFQVFIDYIFKEYEAEYKLVDDIIRKGRIIHRYIKYLFKPGDVVVQGNHQDSRGYLSTTWLEERSQQKRGFDSETYDLEAETEQGLQGSSNERYMIDMKMFRELHKPERKSSSARRDDLGPVVLKQNDPPDDNFIYLNPPDYQGLQPQEEEMVGFREKTKRLIQALISNQIEAEMSTDLITGKGNGLIMLLHGGPGTGKALTAESVAEIAEKPLYPVTCGDIGTKPEEIEEYLESVLHIGKTWGCVVLLDEADVFLEQRGLEDLHRNALVSVFLRVLEYYDGILILTSNRVGIFDEAFKSRIQLALHYKNLSPHQRTQIWGNFFSRLEEINEDGIDFLDLKDNTEELAKHKLNGREIRNVITTARYTTIAQIFKLALSSSSANKKLEVDLAVAEDQLWVSGKLASGTRFVSP
ncbi:hypothetical protein FHL15_006860 [Xylaria flabelliformis]|uniref:AAA+ ATPase domain-containing protein n=1 Tax=Xylaria flabelliformis TaxID=2512241 RepID=A0A553HWC3_9PEZI|nr:hypothetical protein FHL15_006860 [Xylaria flabelliformis]